MVGYKRNPRSRSKDIEGRKGERPRAEAELGKPLDGAAEPARRHSRESRAKSSRYRTRLLKQAESGRLAPVLNLIRLVLGGSSEIRSPNQRTQNRRLSRRYATESPVILSPAISVPS